jgi:hypothetical protein
VGYELGRKYLEGLRIRRDLGEKLTKIGAGIS